MVAGIPMPRCREPRVVIDHSAQSLYRTVWSELESVFAFAHGAPSTYSFCSAITFDHKWKRGDFEIGSEWAERSPRRRPHWLRYLLSLPVRYNMDGVSSRYRASDIGCSCRYSPQKYRTGGGSFCTSSRISTNRFLARTADSRLVWDQEPLGLRGRGPVTFSPRPRDTCRVSQSRSCNGANAVGQKSRM